MFKQVAESTGKAPDIKPNLKRAKLTIMTRSGTIFFSSLLSSLKVVITEDLPTAGTDGIRLVLNPYFVAKLSNEELVFLLLHEVWHVLLEHVIQCNELNLDPRLHNKAGDYYINLRLVGMGLTMPKEGLLDSRFSGMSTMEIYDYLEQNQQDEDSDEGLEMDLIPSNGSPKSNGKDGGKEEGHQGLQPLNMPVEELKQRVKNNILKAATTTKAANQWGSIPQEIQRELEELMNPLLPWEVILQNYMQSYAKDDFTWRRPNRRYWPDLYLPTLHSPALEGTFYGIDVSGSMGQELLDQIQSEIKYTWEILKPDYIRLVGFDTEIHNDYRHEKGEELNKIILNGGGGTELQPIMNMIAEDNPKFAVIFTDGYFTMPDMSEVTCDLYWVIFDNDNFTADKGTVIPARTR